MLDVKGDKSLWEKMNLEGVGRVFLVEESYYNGIIEMIEKLKNELNGYKLSNQSLSNSLEKEIKENERLRQQLKEYPVEYDFDWSKDI